MISLVWPYILVLIIVPFIIHYVISFKPSSKAVDVPFLGQYIATLSKEKQHFSWFFFIIWLLFVLALSRPVWVDDPVTLIPKGRNIQIAVDTSGSMGADDMVLDNKRLDRLSAVKLVVNDFIKNRHGDRLGLILFGSKAYTQAPLTYDLNTVATLLDETFLKIAGNDTAIGDAIALASKKFYELNTKNSDHLPVLILITDGQSNIGKNPINAAQFAKEIGMKIYTIGIGAKEMFRRNIFGQTVRVNPSMSLNEDDLKEIAEITGGLYFRADSLASLEKIYQELNKLEPTANDKNYYHPKKELYYILLIVAFILLCYYFFTSERK